MDEEKLIALIQEYEPLYNTQHKKYNDANIKKLLWKEIGQKMDRSDEQCKEKWSALRDQYRRALRTRKKRRRKVWKFESEMEFLKPFIQTRETTSKSTSTFDVDNQHKIEQNSNENHSSGTDNITNGTSFNPSDYQTPSTSFRLRSQSPSPKRRRSIPPNEEISSSLLMKYILSQNEKLTVAKHPLDNFFSSVADTVKTFSPVFQHMAKTRIFNVVSELESEHLGQESKFEFFSEDG